MFGALSKQRLPSQIFELYSGLVLFTPLLGGLLEDRWMGQRHAVAMGVLTMTLGALAMMFDATFLLALLCLVIGESIDSLVSIVAVPLARAPRC